MTTFLLTGRSVLSKFFFLAVFCIFFLIPLRVSGQSSGVADGETVETNPKNRSISVTATVKPQTAPPAPVLIRPENNSVHRTGVLAFEWYAVTGHLADLHRYELYLNGERKFGSIALVDQVTSDYTLTFNGTYYSLLLKQDKWLPDGTYTWKIRVIDVNDKGTDSTTWTITIDSTAPLLLVQEIDKKPYSISASDESTYPSAPIEVSKRNPVLKGKTEAYSDVQLAVRLKSGKVIQYRTTARSDGLFDIQLVDLPPNEKVHLTFTVVDLAQNTTVLDVIDLIYKPKTVVISFPQIIPVDLSVSVRIPAIFEEIPTTPEEVKEDIEQFAELLFPTEDATVQLTARPVQQFLPVFLLFILSLWAYVTLLFWILGNPWMRYFGFWWQLLLFWFMPFVKRGSHRFVVLQERESVEKERSCGFLAFEVQSLDAKKKLQRKFLWTSNSGFWNLSLQPESLYHIVFSHRRLLYPVSELGISEGRAAGASRQPRVLHLLGESWMQASTQKQRTNENTFVIPAQTLFVFWAWTKQDHSSLLPYWALWMPILALLISILVAFWMTYFFPSLFSLLVLVFTFWVLSRHLQANIQSTLQIATEEKDGFFA